MLLSHEACLKYSDQIAFAINVLSYYWMTTTTIKRGKANDQSIWGVVGASLARELTRWRVRVVVLDRAAELPSGASRANSSMIHGGFDDSPNTLKARFCPEGNRMYHALKDELDFHLDECGSYVCAFDDKDIVIVKIMI